MIKRLFDVVSSAIGLLLSAPLLALICLWIWIEGNGPIFFCQRRIGLNEKPFSLIKFRTMVPETETSQDLGITVAGNSRVKRLSGHFLRKTKFDELPQLVNVLKGDMSIVGPRPEVERYVQLYPQEAKCRVLSVRPGLTDLAALRFSDEASVLAGQDDPEAFYIDQILPAKLQLYDEYIRRQAFWYDIGLILLTVCAILLPSLRRRLHRTF